MPGIPPEVMAALSRMGASPGGGGAPQMPMGPPPQMPMPGGGGQMNPMLLDAIMRRMGGSTPGGGNPMANPVMDLLSNLRSQEMPGGDQTVRGAPGDHLGLTELLLGSLLDQNATAARRGQIGGYTRGLI